MNWISERIEVIKKKTVLGKALFALTYKKDESSLVMKKLIRNKIALISGSIEKESSFFHELQNYEILNLNYGVDIELLRNIYEEQISYLYDLEDFIEKKDGSFRYKSDMTKIIKKLLTDDETYLNELYNLKKLS